MFSTLSGAARASASAANGFGSREPNAFGQDGASAGSLQRKNKRRPRHSDANQNDGDRGVNPFSPKNADRGDGGRQNSKRGGPEKKGPDGSNRSRHRLAPKWQALQDVTGPDESLQSYSSTDESSPPPLRMTPPRSDDPFAKRIYDKLRKDGISPPQWPDKPGDANSSYEMTQFRELHEVYRRKARASLTRAGLIDDPEKRKRLSDAIEFKGVCEDMCPEFEKITRITEHDVNKPERDRSTGVTRVHMMVKKLARSAAGQEAPLPMDVRSVSALRRSLDYLIDVVLRRDENLSSVHPFLWDRTRAIRRDFAFFSSMTEQEIKTQVYVLENITRFHVTSLHLLSRPDQEEDNFVEQQELEQLGKTLLSLRDLYDDCNEQGIQCQNEAEFRAYYLLFHGRDPSILETLQRQWKPDLWRDSDDVRTAVSLVEALQSTQEFIGSRKEGDAGPLLAASGAQLSYFRIVEDANVSYTMACFAECHFPHLRRSILATVKRALARPKNPVQDVTTAALNEFLRFDTVEEAVQFAQLHRLDFTPEELNPTNRGSQSLMLTDRTPLPHVRLNHQFSQSLVERKRGQAPLPSLIHSTVFENTSLPQDARNGVKNEGSLFVPEDQEPEVEPSSENPPTELGGSSNAGASAQTPPSSSLKSRKVSPPKLPFVIESDTDDDDAPNGSATPRPQQQSNPFAVKPNPFGGSASGSAATPKAPSKLPTFEEVKAMDAGNFLSNMPKPRRTGAFNQPGGGGGSSDGSQSAKPNPFASRAPKPNPFASLSGSSTGGNTTTGNTAEAKTNPFAGAVQLASNATTNGNTVSGNALLMKPNPFGPVSESSAKPNPFASLSSPGSSAAIPPANAPSALSGPNGAGAIPGFGPALGGQNASPQIATPSAVTIHGQTNVLGVPAAASPMPFGTSPTAISSSPIAAVGGEQIQQFATSESVPPLTAVSGVPPVSLAEAAEWYVKGDNGLVEDFIIDSISRITKDAFDTFEQEAEEQQRLEEEERVNAEVETFRVYNLRLKFFYRWKRNAREKRLPRRAAERDAKKATADAEERRTGSAAPNRPEEFMNMVKSKRTSNREARVSLLASGVLSGIAQEREAAKMIVNGGSISSDCSQSISSQSLELSLAPAKEGPKTRALRKLYFGQPERFRRSLPSMSSNRDTPDDTNRPSNASSRWRLKAMGIVQLPDGTAVPESLANEMASKMPRHPRSAASWTARRVSATDAIEAGLQRFIPSSTTRDGSSMSAAESSPPTNKRKKPSGQDKDIPMSGSAEGSANKRIMSSTEKARLEPAAETSLMNKRKRSASDDNEETRENGETEGNSHKRIMSDAEKIRTELRALRAELEEGTEWFRAQYQRFRSESETGTPWYDDSM
ncbi:SAC3/GANP family protein [Hirsutella rhossiliensis]|uniref:SAC3/GANP family domain-containing protein n=1 Tax=Hirsutella rhossiliensis TaxID=111463 RepID=A0A9P8N184_9HYPO|nr:SAC3/GANP family domain-containing protein [Hirsutella rhossiliensis]KAH0965057.1 SAC3/GANP family domain-containing protein [Hirsutella rhossiliensis]